VYEVKGRTQEGFDNEPESGVDPGEPSQAMMVFLNVIVGHSVDNPMANHIMRRENKREWFDVDDSLALHKR